jgi:hypothetical protein
MKPTKWWLASMALLCLAPATFALPSVDPKHFDPRQNWSRQGVPEQPVPEGGSSLVYLLGAGAICLGAMLFRARMADPSVSD